MLPLLFAAAASAQERISPWRALRDLEVAGTAAFDRDAIASALVVDRETLQALRLGIDARAAAAVADRVEELHWRGGYTAAKARGEVVGGKLHITLAAGRRLRCGEVRCTGNTLVPTERIRARLGEVRDQGGVGWVQGRFPCFDGTIQRRVVAAAQAVYRDLGRHGATATATFVPDGENLVLELAVGDEGHEVRIASLRLDGDEDARRQVAMAAIGVAPGTLATTAVLEQLRLGLAHSGRYVSVRCEVPPDAPASLDPLAVSVQVRPGAETVDGVAARDAAWLRRAFEVELARLKQGVPLGFSTPITAGMAWGRFRVLPGNVSCSLGRDGFAVVAEQVQWGAGPPARAALCFLRDELTLVAGDRIGRWRFDSAVGVSASVTTQVLTTGEYQLRWGVGMSLGGDGALVTADLHPGTAAYALTKVDEARHDGDDLVLQVGATHVRIAADGRIAGDRIELRDGDTTRTFSLAGPSIVEQRDRLLGPAAAAPCDAASVLLELAAEVLADAVTAPASADVRVQALLRGCVGPIAATGEKALTQQPAEPVPELRGPPTLLDHTTSFGEMISWLASRPVVDRGWQGRLVDLGAAFGPWLAGDGTTAGREFDAIAVKPDHGPLSLGLVATLLDLGGSVRAAAGFRKLALERVGFAAFYADAADLCGHLPGVGAVPAQVGARWRTQPELQELCAGLPAGAEGDVGAWRKGLELLWSAGGERLLREALAEPAAAAKQDAGR